MCRKHAIINVPATVGVEGIEIGKLSRELEQKTIKEDRKASNMRQRNAAQDATLFVRSNTTKKAD